ncbi:MAG: PilZ domain-containing protein [Candidatus Omnitrophica bacterium]|nr:PilZ domain-containing protein [Candidatus Omnitrophota bacterium]
MPRENKNSEKRTDKRFDVELPLKIGGTDFKFVTATKNISSSGIYCNADRFIPVMTKLWLNLTIPLIENNRKIEKNLNCQAVVVRIQPESKIETVKVYQLGLFFVDIKDKDRQVINHYLQHAFFAGNN